MLYPQIKPYHSEYITVANGQQLYVEQSGNPDGYPVVYLHGGPGGASAPLHRSLFDPERYRIILFDQRGCGQSLPFADYTNNTTADLLADMEQIREHLAIDSWTLAGGSWGTTLALLYAQAYPSKVKAILLRGVFLARQQDYQWLYDPSGGAAHLFPDYYQDFIEPLHNCQIDSYKDVFAHYWPLLTSDNEIEQLHAARQWCMWEAKVSRLQTSQNVEVSVIEKHNCLPLALLECHYFKNASFIEENQILNNMSSLNDIPATIIHGRYDAVCDVSQAWHLNQAWPNSKLMIVPEAGHSLVDAGIAHGFCQASSAIADYLSEQ